MDSEDEIAFEDSDQEMSTVSGYEILDQSALESELKDLITDVQDVLEVSPGVAQILLMKFKWNKGALMEKFYESQDANAFLADAQIIPKPKEGKPALRQGECAICCDETELTGLACGHESCSMCWEMYLVEKIKSGVCQIQCMASDCNLIMGVEMILSYLTDNEVIVKYRHLVLRNYVEANSVLGWCPGANCEKVVQVNYNEPQLIECSCGTRFCFSCSNDSHKPATCHLIRQWKKKCQEMQEKKHTGEGYGTDSETFQWIMSNTKDCPKCFVSIEKNGGCNYMQCRNENCRFQFCWICMKDWNVHRNGWYSCNAYDANADAKRESSRAEFHRFLFYYTRYINHEKSLKLEENLRKTIRQKMEDMEKLSLRWIDVQYLQKAVDTLSECRRTMKNTYVFAYYLKRDNNSLIFETNQRDLEMATEQLSGYLERDIDDTDFDTLRQNVLDKSRYVEHRLQILQQHCEEGKEQDLWEFVE
uniref:RBR-type E3 ubiquitin transferase n=1 Tax=Caenorhabditis tropicalis TaxID=1561998 RepID=A0A1I7TGW8_9PELO